MALRMGALYDALRTAQGISEDDARRAAEEIAGYDNRMVQVERDLAVLKWAAATALVILLWLASQVWTIRTDLTTLRSDLAAVLTQKP